MTDETTQFRLAVAMLREPGTPPHAPHRRALGVVNVPDGLIELEPRDHDCVVHGDLARGIVAIDVDGATLLPAPGPYRNVPPA